MKRLLLVIGLILLVLLILGFIAPKTYVIEREIEINAPKNHVYEFMNSLESLYQWSTLEHADSALDISFVGTTGTVGSFATWESKEESTEGRETILNINPFYRIKTEIRRLRPWESLNHNTVSVRGQDETSTVIWHFDGHSPFPFNIRHLFTDMDEELGPTFERGLSILKKRAERTFTELKYGIQRKESTPYKRFLLDVSDEGFEEIKTDAITVLKDEYKLRLPDSLYRVMYPMALIYNEDEADTTLPRYAYEMPIFIDSKSLQTDTMFSFDALIARHVGGYGSLAKTYDEVERYLQNQALTFKFPIEERYVTNASNEPDSAKWLTILRFQLEK